jgi:dTDP-4-dehydrorhamnose reductase
MRILLLGKVGQLGWELQRSLAVLGEVRAFDYPEINFAEPAGLLNTMRELRPQVIVNAAAYTAVDRAENEVEIATAINGETPGLLAEEARRLGSAFIHYSTEYVFDGKKGESYREEDAPNPLNVYGRSKLLGEQNVQQAGGAYLVLRTSWVYSTRQGGFVNKVLEWARKQRLLRIVSDQVGNPTWCRMLAEATAQLLAASREDPAAFFQPVSGLYHLAGSGSASRLEWAQAILDCDPAREEQIVEEIQPAETAEFPTPAVRPLYSPLNCARFSETFGLRLPDWQEALRLALDSAH